MAPSQQEAESLVENILRMVDDDAGRPIPFGFRTAADDLIDSIRARLAGGDDIREPLKTAMDDILGRILQQLSETGIGPDTTARELQRAGMISFAATELRIPLDGRLLSEVVGKTMPGIAPESYRDLLLVLRTLGRQDDPAADEVFWNGLLVFPDGGIRTIVAQNLIRIDPVAALRDIRRIIDHDTYPGLVGFDLLRAMGSAEQLATEMIASRTPRDDVLLVMDLLESTGETEAAHLVGRRLADRIGTISRGPQP